MTDWKRLYPKPAGSLPGGIVTQWGVALITVLILVFVAIWLATGGSEQAGIDSIGGEVTGPARNFAGQMAAQVEAEYGPTGRDAPGGGGANPTGRAAPGGAGVRNGRDRRRAGDDARKVFELVSEHQESYPIVTTTGRAES